MGAREAGLVPREAGYLAHGSIVRAVRSSDEQRISDTLTDGVRGLITASGGVRIEDEYRYLVATA